MCTYNIFRTLNADEIDVRVQQVAEKNGKAKAILLLYKNARVDMDMLDERFGCLGWQREHSFKEGKNYCKVSVYDADKQMWISKEDVGVESNTEETKGEASDSFKRACVNLGIGRELYSSPSILVELNDKEWKKNEKSGKAQIHSWIKFRVAGITYNAERRIIGLCIADANGNLRYIMGEAKQPTAPTQPTAPQQKGVQREKQMLTMDMILDDSHLANVCKFIHDKWSNRRNASTTIADVIKYFYACDAEVIDCITKEIERVWQNAH